MPELTLAATPLDETVIAALLGDAAPRFLVEVLPECASTNTDMLARCRNGAPSGSVLLAEHQSAGRGRRGRTWYANAAGGLTFSILWRFPPKCALTGLTLAVGVALTEAMGPQVQLKWPNDILLEGRKIAGVLVELADSHTAVIGIGVNLAVPQNLPAEVAATAGALPVEPHNADFRAVLLARILRALLPILDRFAHAGFAPLRSAWQARNAYQDRAVSLTSGVGPARIGFCRGVDADGAFLLETRAGIERILSGDVSVRLQ